MSKRSKAEHAAGEDEKNVDKSSTSKWEQFAENEGNEQAQEVANSAGETPEDTAQESEQQTEAGIELEPRGRLEKELNAAEAKIQELMDKIYRSSAELQNAQKRAKIDVGRAREFALENFANGLLPVLDSMEHSLDNLNGKEGDLENLREGWDLTYKMLLDVLKQFGVTQLDPKGETFDPHQHEAMAMEETDDVATNTVLKVFQKGYLLHERVLRPARVVVSKSTAKT